jgi:hypothetical protein
MRISILAITCLSAALASAALTGCGDDDESGSGGSAAATTSATTTASSSDATTSATTGTGGSGGGGTTCQTDICATYGAAVPAVAGAIVDQAAADPEFSADFAPLVAQGTPAVDAFKTSLANFISDAYGCTTGAYTGPDMVTAHTGMAITQTEYDDFIALIAGVLSGAGVPDDDINYCFAPALVDPTFAATIVGQ